MTTTDWSSWHHPYDEPGSSLQRRLARVQSRLRQALADQPPGPIAVLSMCAGQGRDLLGVLPDHPRRPDVRALLVEQDPQNVAVAEAAGLEQVTVHAGDASLTTAYAGIVPADIALVCGVFGNIPDQHVHDTIHRLPQLLRTGATVIWTRHHGDPDLTPAIRSWFGQAGFAELGFDTEPGFRYSVGTHQLTAPGQPFEPGVTLFRFEGDGIAAYE
jgi:hypothetical protein